MFQPAFGCTQHPKAGRNTQQVFKELDHTISPVFKRICHFEKQSSEYWTLQQSDIFGPFEYLIITVFMSRMGLVPVLRLGVLLRYKASKFWYPIKIPPLYNYISLKKKCRWEIRKRLNATNYFLNTKSEPSVTCVSSL